MLKIVYILISIVALSKEVCTSIFIITFKARRQGVAYIFFWKNMKENGTYKLKNMGAIVVAALCVCVPRMYY